MENALISITSAFSFPAVSYNRYLSNRMRFIPARSSKPALVTAVRAAPFVSESSINNLQRENAYTEVVAGAKYLISTVLVLLLS